MSSTSQSVVRVAALALMTALFAGLWANDQPEHYLALRTSPGDVQIAQQRPRSAIVATVRQNTALNIAGLAKSIELETDGLLLTRTALTLHVAQLPLGIPAGDYRIVDGQGGVGWLRIRADHNDEFPVELPAMLTTTVGQDVVRFLRTQPTSVGSGSGFTTR